MTAWGARGTVVADQQPAPSEGQTSRSSQFCGGEGQAECLPTPQQASPSCIATSPASAAETWGAVTWGAAGNRDGAGRGTVREGAKVLSGAAFGLLEEEVAGRCQGRAPPQGLA